MSKVKKIGGLSFANTKAGTYALAFNGSTDDVYLSSFLNLSGAWETDPVSFGGVKIIPFGADNNLPANIRGLLEKNNLGPGILARKTGLHYAQGPFLYKLAFENNEINKVWTEDAEVQAWLDTWDYKEYVRNAIQEFNYLQGFFAKYFIARGRRIGSKPWISKLSCEHSNDCRLEWPQNDGRTLDDVKSIIVGDFENMRRSTMDRYPIFDKANPSASAVSMKYHSFRSFSRYFYALSSFFGSIPWVKRANDIPEIIQYLTENMIAAAYHVHQPAQYWQEKRDLIQAMHPDWDEVKTHAEIDRLRDLLTETIASVLAGKKAVGKFFESIDFIDDAGHKCEWKIEPIEMNIDKYIDAQAKISKIADSSTTSGFGLNPALSNIIIDGKGDSGSQMLYALKIFYAADSQICEDIVFEPLNTALKINFPGKSLSMGIYTKATNKEDNVSASSRVVNQK